MASDPTGPRPMPSNSALFCCLEERLLIWILEGDIKSCFDTISHPWLLGRIPMDKVVLRKWLRAGYIDQRTFFPSMANMVLDGLEKILKDRFPPRCLVHLVRYADDCATRKALSIDCSGPNIWCSEPAVSSAVIYLHRRGWQRPGRKLQGQCTLPNGSVRTVRQGRESPGIGGFGGRISKHELPYGPSCVSELKMRKGSGQQGTASAIP